MANIDISLVFCPPKARSLDKKTVKAIADSFHKAGPLQPIVVMEHEIYTGTFVPGFRLIVGGHRLQAAKDIGWQQIEATVLPAGTSPVLYELMEVDENLCRAELTAVEKAQALKKRKMLWASLKEQQNSGNLIATNRGPGMPQGFASSTAESTGISKQAINQYLSITDQLSPDELEKISGTSLDSKTELQALASMEPEDRCALIEEAAQGEKVSAAKRPADQPKDYKRKAVRILREIGELPEPFRLFIWERMNELLADRVEA